MRAVVVRPGAKEPGRASGFVTGVGGKDQDSGSVRSSPDRLGEALLIMGDEPDRPLHDRDRAAVVHLEVHTPEAGQDRVERKDAAHIGQAPAVDRLIVVAHQEDAIRRGGQEQREPKLRPIHILDLVHEQMSAARPPACEQPGIGIQAGQCPTHQIVEIESAALGEGPLIPDEGARHGTSLGVCGHFVGGHRVLQLEP